MKRNVDTLCHIILDHLYSAYTYADVAFHAKH